MQTTQLHGIAPVILGFLAWKPRSGYEIKQLVDRSTRFFWAASYGSIYPQLHRLREEGLVAGDEQPTGARQRTVYSLTPAGRDALEAWLRSSGSTWELRDTGLLRVFFAGALPRDEALEALRAYGAEHERVARELRGVRGGIEPKGFPGLALEYGIGLHEWSARWAKETEERLLREGPGEESS